MEATINPETGEVLEDKKPKEYRNQPEESQIPTQYLLDELYGLKMRKKHAMKPHSDAIKEIDKKFDPEIKALEDKIRDHCMCEQKTISGKHLQVIYQDSYMRLNPDTVRQTYPEIFDNCCEETKVVTRIREVAKKADN